MMKNLFNMINDKVTAKRSYQIGRLCFGRNNDRVGIMAKSKYGKDNIVVTLPIGFVENLDIYMADEWESSADMVSMIDIDFPIIYHADYKRTDSCKWITEESFCMSVTHAGLFIMLDLNEMREDGYDDKYDRRASFGIQQIFISRYEIRRNAMKLMEYAGKERRNKNNEGKITRIVNE